MNDHVYGFFHGRIHGDESLTIYDVKADKDCIADNMEQKFWKLGLEGDLIISKHSTWVQPQNPANLKLDQKLPKSNQLPEQIAESLQGILKGK